MKSEILRHSINLYPQSHLQQYLLEIYLKFTSSFFEKESLFTTNRGYDTQHSRISVSLVY